MEGEQLKATVAGQAFELTSKDLVLIITLLIIGGMFYVTYSQISKDLDKMTNHHYQITTLITEQTKEITRLLTIVDYNFSKSEENKLPLTTDKLDTFNEKGGNRRDYSTR